MKWSRGVSSSEHLKAKDSKSLRQVVLSQSTQNLAAGSVLVLLLLVLGIKSSKDEINKGKCACNGIFFMISGAAIGNRHGGWLQALVASVY